MKVEGGKDDKEVDGVDRCLRRLDQEADRSHAGLESHWRAKGNKEKRLNEWHTLARAEVDKDVVAAEAKRPWPESRRV